MLWTTDFQTAANERPAPRGPAPASASTPFAHSPLRRVRPGHHANLLGASRCSRARKSRCGNDAFFGRARSRHCKPKYFATGCSTAVSNSLFATSRVSLENHPRSFAVDPTAANHRVLFSSPIASSSSTGDLLLA